MDEIKNTATSPQTTSIFLESTVLSALSAVILIIVSAVIGTSDLLFLVVWLAVTANILVTVYKIKIGLRKTIATLFSHNSFIFDFLNKKSALQWFLSFLIAIGSALSFLLLLKLLFLKHTFIEVVFVLVLPVYLYQLFYSKNFKYDSASHLRSDAGQETVSLILNIFTKALLMTFFMSLAFSFLDTYSFYINQKDFINFGEIAQQHAIPLNENGGFYSRATINFIVIVDSFTAAALNELLSFYEVDKDTLSPLFFGLASLLMNMIKLLPFNIAYLFIVLTLQYHLMAPAYQLITKLIIKIKSKFFANDQHNA